MDYTILQAFRRALYQCFTRAADALFDLCDALLTDPAARTFVELSQAAAFERAWPSLYEALQDGQIDRAALLQLFVAALPQHLIGTRLLLGLDTSSILRPDAQTSATARWSIGPICRKTPHRSGRAGASRRWWCCPIRSVAGPMCWTIAV
jgi:hypothetical protein